MRCVILESPYAGKTKAETDEFVRYARQAMFDCLMRGDAPMASHLLYTHVLKDKNPNDRMLGMKAGAAWLRFASATVVYHDHGVSSGMRWGIDHAHQLGIPVEYRLLGKAVIDNLQPELFSGDLAQ